MLSKKNIIALVLLTLGGVAGASSPQTREQDSAAQEKPKKYTRQNFDRADFESQFPVTDYHAQEPADPEELAKRRARSGRYDKRSFVGRPENSWKGTGAYWYNHWDRDLEDLPADQSDIVVVGKVSDARAYLSNGKSGVYSEFALRVERVMKGEAPGVAPGKVVEAEREGGRVRFSAEDIDTYEIAGMGMPRPGRRYVFFLKSVETQPGYYSIIRAFEIHGNRIYPLDRRDHSRSPLDAYWEMEEGAFEQIVKDKIRKAAANESALAPPPPPGGRPHTLPAGLGRVHECEHG